MYSSPAPAQVLALLRRYGVGYVYVGPLEQLYYPPAGLAKFEAMSSQGLLRQVYRTSQVTIYAVGG